MRTLISRVVGVAGASVTLWLFTPGVAHAAAASPCSGVTYGGVLTAAEAAASDGDPCGGASGVGTAAVDGALALGTAAVPLALSARGGAPGRRSGGGAMPPPKPPVPPAAAPPGQPSDGNGPTQTGGDPVDVVSGQMITSETDVELPGLLPMALRRAYASGYGAGRLYGPGWSSTVDQRVELDEQGIHYLGDDAQTLSYPYPALPGQAVWPYEGARWPLVRDTDGSIRIHDPQSGWTRYFTASPDLAIHPISALTDRNGNWIKYHHDPVGLPTEVEHSGGYRVAVDTEVYAIGMRVVALRLLDGTNDGRGTPLRGYGYDARGRLVAVTDSAGAVFRYVHDHADRVSAWIDRNGHRYQYTYDEVGRVVRGDGPLGILSASFAYDARRRVTIVTDSLGRRTEYHYDRHNHVNKTVGALGNIVRTESDQYGRILVHADELGATTSFTLDDQGAPARIDRPDGTSLSVLYNELRLPVRVTGPDGEQWQYTYDQHGNMLTRTDPLGAVTAYTYGENGRLESITDPLGSTQHVETDAAGLPIAVTDALGNTTRLTRDASGRVIEVCDPLGKRTLLGWTAEGLLASRTHPDGAVERWRHDAEGNQTEYQDPNGGTSAAEYGPFGTPVARTSPDGARHRLGYDRELRLLSVTGPTGLVWRYERDPAGRLVSETDFNGRRLHYRLDAAGQLVERVNGAGQRTAYRRDPLGRVVEARHDTGAATLYAYDPNGRLLRAQNPDALVEYTRDRLGRVLTETVNGRTLTYDYDAAGRVTRRTTPTGAISQWSYDPVGLPTALAAGDAALSLRHDAAGRETDRYIGADLALTQTWDAAGRLAGQALWTRDVGGESRALQQRSYTYRPDGTPTRIADRLRGIRRFDLDPLGRVTAVASLDSGVEGTERYAYDALGNLTYAQWLAPEDDAAQGGRVYIGTLIREAGHVSYQHDAQGRIVRKTQRAPDGGQRAWTYTWDADDQLTSAALPDGTVWRYRYDPLGRRIAKQRVGGAQGGGGVGAGSGQAVEEIVFTWDGTRLAEQVHSTPDGRATTLTWDHEPGTHRPAAQRRRSRAAQAPQDQIDAAFHAIITDLVGTPAEMVAPDGELVAAAPTALWDPAAAQSATCPLRFPGQYHDPETGLHYNYLRYYDPDAAAYASADPLGLASSPNPYRYVDNPMTWLDPLGLQSCSEQDRSWGGRVTYGRLDNLGRPTGITAAVERDMLGNGTPAARSIRPPGFTRGMPLGNDARGHLLGAQLGGSGRIPENLVTLVQDPVNTPIMRGYENMIRQAVEGGETVNYRVTPVYNGGELVPRAVTLEATGSDGFQLALSLLNWGP